MKKFFIIYFIILVLFLCGAVYFGNFAKDKIMASSAVNFINSIRGSEKDNLDDRAKDYIIERVVSGDNSKKAEEDANIDQAKNELEKSGTIEDVIKEAIKDKAKEEAIDVIDNYGN